MAQNKDKSGKGKMQVSTTVVAQLEVTWPGSKEIVLSFDKAWRRSLVLADEGHSPVASKFIAFVRKPELA